MEQHKETLKAMAEYLISDVASMAEDDNDLEPLIDNTIKMLENLLDEVQLSS